MKWKIPPEIKIYEALGAIANGRVEVDGNTAKVYSSSGRKSYTVIYDPDSNAITANDTGSYWQSYLGYPSIALLMIKGIIRYNPVAADWLKSFHWKDINTQYKSDYARVIEYIRSEMIKSRKADLAQFDQELAQIMTQIKQLGLKKLSTGKVPPKAY